MVALGIIRPPFEVVELDRGSQGAHEVPWALSRKGGHPSGTQLCWEQASPSSLKMRIDSVAGAGSWGGGGGWAERGSIHSRLESVLGEDSDSHSICELGV